MSIVHSNRQATTDEITAEMDRRGEVIESLETALAAKDAEIERLKAALAPFADDLRNHPENIDDGWLDGTPYVKRSVLKISHLRAARAALRESDDAAL